MDTAEANEIMLNNIKYVRADSIAAPQPNGNRAIIVADRGWIFAGDVTEADGRIKLGRAVWVFRWESIGFAKMIEDWKSGKVDIRKISDVDLPSGAEVFRVPVANEWGLK